MCIFCEQNYVWSIFFYNFLFRHVYLIVDLIVEGVSSVSVLEQSVVSFPVWQAAMFFPHSLLTSRELESNKILCERSV